MKTFTRPLSLSLLGGALLALGLVGARGLPGSSRADGPPAEAPAGPGKGAVCFGHVDLEHGVTALCPLVVGRVTAAPAQENQEVKAGTVLVRLDDYQARRRVQEAEADLTAARESLAQALNLPAQHQARVAQQRAAIEAVQHRLEGGRQILARKRQLARKDLVNAREVKAAEALVQELQALERAETSKLRELELNDPAVGVRSAQASVTAKQARLDEARRRVEECALKAPVDGRVLRVLVGPGDVLGAQPNKPAVLFCPRGRRLIRAEVEQEFASRVAVGQAALIQDDASSGPTWKGRVLRISDWYTQRRSVMREPSRFNDVRTLECLITIDPGQPPLRIGQRVRVTLRPGQ